MPSIPRHDAARIGTLGEQPAVTRWYARTETYSSRYRPTTPGLACDSGLIENFRPDSPTTLARPVDSSRRGGPVAVLVVRSIDLDEGMAEVAYWTVPAARGRNIAARAVRAASTWMFRSVGLHRLELSHSTLNPAWCRIAEKAGYPYEGTRHLPMGYRPTPGDRERTHEMTRMSLTPARHLQSRHQGFYA